MLQDSSGELFPYLLTLCYQKEERGWTWSLLKYKLFLLFFLFQVKGRGRKEQLWQHSFVIFRWLLRLLLAGWLVFSGCAGLWHHCKLLGSQGPSAANFWPWKLCLFYSYPVILSFLHQESKPRCRQSALCIEWICKGVTSGLTNHITTHLKLRSCPLSAVATKKKKKKKFSSPDLWILCWNFAMASFKECRPRECHSP